MQKTVAVIAKLVGYIVVFAGLTVICVPLTGIVVGLIIEPIAALYGIYVGPPVALLMTILIALRHKKPARHEASSLPSQPIEASYTTDVMTVVNKHLWWRNREN